MVKKKLDLLRNSSQFKVILHLNLNRHNSYTLAEIDSFSKSQSVAHRELSDLKQQGYLGKEGTTYYLKRERIVEEFYNYYLNFLNEISEKYLNVDEIGAEDYYSFKYNKKISSDKRKIINNKIITDSLFQYMGYIFEHVNYENMCLKDFFHLYILSLLKVPGFTNEKDLHGEAELIFKIKYALRFYENLILKGSTIIDDTLSKLLEK